jgi:7-cyano-7-deazaguanine reductase
MSSIPLGRKTEYTSEYDKSLLFPIPRELKRKEIGIRDLLPFNGFDIWNAFEISWLDFNGKPHVAIGEFVFPATSDNIIESKSFKLYLNSFNNTQFKTKDDITETIKNDLSQATNSDVTVKIIYLNDYNNSVHANLDGINIDENKIESKNFVLNREILRTDNQIVSETLNSNLLKSNCLITNQPDWGSVMVKYTGKKIDHSSLLSYIVSYRNHNEFHEQCIERIFSDILEICKPTELSVYARYTRRGGLDINPFRTNEDGFTVENIRLNRQ